MEEEEPGVDPSFMEPSEFRIDMKSTLSIQERVKSSTQPSFMDRRRMFNVIVDGINLTPEDITDPNFPAMEEHFKHAAFATSTRAADESQIKIAKSSYDDVASMKVYATTINIDDIHINHKLNTEESVIQDEVDLDRAPSAYYLPKIYPVTSYPAKIFVALKESYTVTLFDLPCIAYDRGSSEGATIEEENLFYEYITVGKGRNRKMVSEETQTKEVITQTRHTLATKPEKRNAMSFASMWDMHDTYAKMALVKKTEAKDEMVLYQSVPANMMRKKKQKVEVEVSLDKTYEEIASTPEFLDAVLLTERVLASLDYSSAQKKFRDLVPMNPLSLDLVYIYTLKRLWIFECEDTANKPILYVAFNPKNPNILASCHGKFTYAEECNGMICVWCTKNPCTPERLYRFKCPVTSVAFSEKNPNWLACGFWNGDVIILDITYYTIKKVAVSSRETNPCFSPIWGVYWKAMDKESEYVMTICEDGRINRFASTKTGDFLCTPMMRVATVEGKLRGIVTPKTCLKTDVPIMRYPGVMLMKWHPTISHIYLVGTVEGCIHRCSTHYLNQHIDVFQAHAGPVYDMMISPFNKSLMASCGADNAIRFWIEGIDDVIITLPCPAAVYGIAFCPINSTIILSVSGNKLLVWDIRRRIHMPCAEYPFPNNVTLTYVHFGDTGKTVFIADTTGKIYTFYLEDLPISPFYQRTLLDQVVKTSLCTRPQVLKQLLKLEKMREAREVSRASSTAMKHSH